MNKKNRKISFVAAIVLFVFSLYISNIITGLKGDLKDSKNKIEDYKDALEEANNNIDQANANIKYAQSSAWSSYQEMGETLENLETVKNVSDPSKSVFLSLPKLPKLKLNN